MRIAYLLRFWPNFGGGETVTRVLANEFCRRGHFVAVYYLWDRSGGVDVEVDGRISARKALGISDFSNDGVIKKRDYGRIQKQFRDFIKQDKIDIVINQWIPPDLCAKIVKKLGVRLITCNHGMIKYVPAYYKSLKEKVFYKVFGDNAGFLRIYFKYKPGVLKSDRYVCLCQPYVEDIKRLYKVNDNEKVLAIANPCAYRNVPASVMERKEKEIVYVGRVIDIKRVSLLLDAWKFLEDRRLVAGWRFSIVGEGPDLESCKAHAAALGCKRVSFEGFKEPKEYYERASVFVFASCQEGWGLVLVEAQMHGCVPVVMNSSPCFKYIIQNGQNGFLVEEKDVDAFAGVVYKLITDEPLRKKMASNAMKSSKQYLASNIAVEWENLFDEVMRPTSLSR